MNNYKRGTVETTYDALVKTFGKPDFFNGDKTTVEWEFEREINGRMELITIYDWKQTSTPKGIFHWSIGGTSDQNPAIVARELGI